MMNGKCLILLAIGAAMLLHDPAPGLATSVPAPELVSGIWAASDGATIGDTMTVWDPIYPTDAFFVISRPVPGESTSGVDVTDASGLFGAAPPVGEPVLLGPGPSVGEPVLFGSEPQVGDAANGVVPEPLTLLGVLLGVGYAGQYLRRRNGRTKLSPAGGE